MSIAESSPQPLPGSQRVWLLGIAAINGAAVMALELLGARMLSVSFGGSLTVWAAMIAVTLLSLSLGYVVGGRLSERRPNPSVLYIAVLIAAILTAACPYARPLVSWCAGTMGVRCGVLSASAILFFVPLVLLGITGPFVIRMLSLGGRAVGITSGNVYAVSTLGSVAGTLLTGLWLIPAFGTAMSFKITAVALALGAVIGLLLPRPTWRSLVAIFPLAMGFLPLPGLAVGATYTAPDGDPVKVLAVQDSPYARLVVLEKGTYHLLVANGIVQTGVPRTIVSAQKAEALSGKYYQELLPYTVDDPAGRKVLIVGLAGGMTASLLRQYDMDVESVDLDPAIIELARRYFWFQGSAVADDGRRFMEKCGKKYDFCVIDTYSGDVFPFHLSSVEAFRSAQAVLKDDGILALNFIGSPKGMAFACIYRTLQKVFSHVKAIRGEDSDDVQTITLMASSRPIEFNNGWTRYMGDFRGIDPIGDSLRRLSVEPPSGEGFVLTDDHNPIDYLRTGEALRWRERTLTFIGRQAMQF